MQTSAAMQSYKISTSKFQPFYDLHDFGQIPDRTAVPKNVIINHNKLQLTERRTDPLETVTLPQLVKKLPSFYDTRMFITILTTARD
jgi:hypothetical protein